MISGRRDNLLLSPALRLLLFPSAALAHDFSSMVQQGASSHCCRRFHSSGSPFVASARLRFGTLLAVLVSWLAAIAAVFGLQSAWPLLILSAPCIAFLILAKPNDRRWENAP